MTVKLREEVEITLTDGLNQITHLPDQAIAFFDSTEPTNALISVERRTIRAGYFTRSFRLVDNSFLVPTGGKGNRDAYCGIASAVRCTDSWLAAYHMEDQSEMLPLDESGSPGFFASIGFVAIAINGSRLDETQNWPHFGTSHCSKIRESDIPEDTPVRDSYAAQGIGCPSLSRTEINDKIRCYYTDWGKRRERNLGICVAEGPSNLPPNPEQWKKWDRVSFTLPINGGDDREILSMAGGDVFDAQVQYLEEWKLYLMIFSARLHSENRQRPEYSGIYYATSRNGTEWSYPDHLWRGIHPSLTTGFEAAVHPTLWKFTANGASEWLLFYGYSDEYRSDNPHRLRAKKATVGILKI